MESSNSTRKMDSVLWQKFKNGDKEAFIKIYQKYYPQLLNYGLRIKRNEGFIEDCIQEIFYDLLRTAKNLGPTDNILFYLFASLRRKIFRKLKYDISFREDDNFYFDGPELAERSSEDAVIEDEGNQQRKKYFKELIGDLPSRQKEALLMRFYLHIEYSEIAKIMEMNVQSVRNLVHKAIKTLREKTDSNIYK
ncbi:MAG: sigma-70 family RNA polymerase sigma factor [Bacteroidales bacterium]